MTITFSGGISTTGEIIANPNIPLPFIANAVHFDGTNDFLTRGAGLTGAADVKLGVLSCWVKNAAGGGQQLVRFETGGSARLDFLITGVDLLNMKLNNPINTLIMSVVSNIVIGDSWTHILVSWDLGRVAGDRIKIYLNDIDQTAVPTTEADDVVEWTTADAAIGARVSGASKFDGDMSEFYLTDEFLDLDVEANRRKFISAGGKPVELGSDGSDPTGTAPLIYFSGTTDSWHTNKGSGGGFTENGALTTASTSPSD